jgi:serine/threonine-protein kinase RsbW
MLAINASRHGSPEKNVCFGGTPVSILITGDLSGFELRLSPPILPMARHAPCSKKAIASFALFGPQSKVVRRLPHRLDPPSQAPDVPRMLRFHSPPADASAPARMINRALEFSSHAGNLSLVRRFVRQFLIGQGCGESLIDLMVLGIDEACTNIIRYAYGNAEDQLIRLTLERTTQVFRCRLRDYGSRIEASQLNGRALELVRPGGLGLHLIRQAFDDAYYQTRPKGTELVLIKTLPVELLVAGDEQLGRNRAA